MDVKKLLDSIKELSEQDFVNLLQKMYEIEPLNNLLSKLSPGQRISTLKKITTFAQNDVRPESILQGPPKTTIYDPAYTRLDFVDCMFTGVGYEWDSKHIALVWDIFPGFDSVMVIPTTSQKRKESKNVFSVKTVSGLSNKETTLLIGDMTRVSRKRLRELVPYIHPIKGPLRPRLPTAWLDRIHWGIVTTYASEMTFQEALMNLTGGAMVMDLRTLFNNRFKPVKIHFERASNLLYYRMWNSDTFTREQLIVPRNGFLIWKEVKAKLIEDLFSEDLKTREHAEADYINWYHK